MTIEVAMTDEAKVERMVAFLTWSHLYVHGGYEYDHQWVGDTLVVAGLDDGKERQRTEIETYTRKALIDWYDRADEYARHRELDMTWPEFAGYFGDWMEAFYENKQ